MFLEMADDGLNGGTPFELALDLRREAALLAARVDLELVIGRATIAPGTRPSVASQGGGNLIAFDPTSGITAGMTRGIYISSYGTGVYHTINGGSTWRLTAGSPTTHQHMIVDENGVVMACRQRRWYI
jgi:hypothetical protein